ncbi:MAG: hypothetical protein AAFQ20_06600 [Bacteroidota bacterium]
MKTSLIFVLTLLLPGFSCIKKTDDRTLSKKSDFNLKTDFTKLTEKITELDTIKIWADLSSCMWMTTEKITLTKSNDSLEIELHVVQMTDPEVVETIKIHEKDTTWGFNKFLANNKYRLVKTEERGDVNLRIKHSNDSIELHTGHLGDLNRFIGEYYESMYRLKPKNKAYQFMMEISAELD